MKKSLSKSEHLPIILFNLLVLGIFSVIYLRAGNTEFYIYLGVYLFFLLLTWFSTRQQNYSNLVLWGLSIWALLHMAGGAVYLGGIKLYETMIFHLSDAYHIFRYDQFVHFFGFGVATLLMFELLKPSLKQPILRWKTLGILIVMAGAGVGALNEMIEFSAVVLVQDTGVGDYTNNALDLVFNFFGAIFAWIIIYFRESADSSKLDIPNS